MDPWGDFWIANFPTWAGAIGSIAAAVLALVAILRDIQTRKGVRNVAAGTAPSTDIQEGSASDSADVADQAAPQTPRDLEAEEAAMRDLIRRVTQFSDLRARPASQSSGAILLSQPTHKAKMIENVSDLVITVYSIDQVDGGDDIVAPGLPRELAPGEALRFGVDRSLASPTVIAADVRWGDGNGDRFARRVLLD